MRYISIKWVHKNPADPVQIYSEIGDDGYEVRRLELWANGRKGFATAEEEVGGTALSSLPIPSLKEIAEQPGFEPKAIAAEDFQNVWMKRR